ncbi:MAG: alpha/beta hydrolase [Smithella sp.]
MVEFRVQSIDGVGLPYLFFESEASAPQMIFMHATGFLPWLWEPVIEDFVLTNNIRAPFICDYRSSNPETGLSWDIIARDLSDLCRLQQIREPLIVGHSMGATISVIATSLYGLQPRGLVLIEPIFLPDQSYTCKYDIHSHPLASKSIKRVNHWNNEIESWSYLKSKPFFSRWDERVLRLYHKYGMQKQEDGSLRLTCSPQSEAALFMGGRIVNPWPLLPKINCPVLIIEGEISENKKFVDIQKAVSQLCNCRYRSVAGAGHLIPMEKPKEISEIIKVFDREIMKNASKY